MKNACNKFGSYLYYSLPQLTFYAKYRRIILSSSDRLQVMKVAVKRLRDLTLHDLVIQKLITFELSTARLLSFT